MRPYSKRYKVQVKIGMKVSQILDQLLGILDENFRRTERVGLAEIKRS